MEVMCRNKCDNKFEYLWRIKNLTNINDRKSPWIVNSKADYSYRFSLEVRDIRVSRAKVNKYAFIYIERTEFEKFSYKYSIKFYNDDKKFYYETNEFDYFENPLLLYVSTYSELLHIGGHLNIKLEITNFDEEAAIRKGPDSALYLLYKNHQFVDTVIVVGDREIFAHAVVLAESSDYFRSCLQSDAIMTTLRNVNGNDIEVKMVRIEEFDVQTVTSGINFLYKNDVPFEECKSELLAFAQAYDLLKLKAFIEEKLVKKITCSTFNYYLNLANHYESQKLKMSCINYFLLNTKDLMTDTHDCTNILSIFDNLGKKTPGSTKAMTFNPINKFCHRFNELYEHQQFCDVKIMFDYPSIYDDESSGSEHEDFFGETLYSHSILLVAVSSSFLPFFKTKIDGFYEFNLNLPGSMVTRPDSIKEFMNYLYYDKWDRFYVTTDLLLFVTKYKLNRFFRLLLNERNVIQLFKKALTTNDLHLSNMCVKFINDNANTMILKEDFRTLDSELMARLYTDLVHRRNAEKRNLN